MTYIPSSSFPSCATSSLPFFFFFFFFTPPFFPCVLFFAFPEDTDDSHSNSPVWGYLREKKKKGRENAEDTSEETGWRNRARECCGGEGGGGEEIRGRDCEPRRLFLVPSCVSHSEKQCREDPPVNVAAPPSFVTHIGALKPVFSWRRSMY